MSNIAYTFKAIFLALAAYPATANTAALFQKPRREEAPWNNDQVLRRLVDDYKNHTSGWDLAHDLERLFDFLDRINSALPVEDRWELLVSPSTQQRLGRLMEKGEHLLANNHFLSNEVACSAAGPRALDGIKIRRKGEEREILYKPCEYETSFGIVCLNKTRKPLRFRSDELAAEFTSGIPSKTIPAGPSFTTK